MRGGEKCRSRETDETEGRMRGRENWGWEGEDGVSEGRNEEREMSRRIRGGRDFDLSLRALVFTFNTAAGTSPSPSLTLLPLSITSLQHTSPVFLFL